MEIFYVKYIQPDFHKFLQKTTWENCSFTFVWTQTIYCHTHSACEHKCLRRLRNYELCAKGLVSRVCMHNFQYPILVPGNTEYNFIVLFSGLKSQEAIPRIIYNSVTEWLSDHDTSWSYSYIMNADTVHLGGNLVAFINLRFKSAYRKGTKAWRVWWQQGFYHRWFVVS